MSFHQWLKDHICILKLMKFVFIVSQYMQVFKLEGLVPFLLTYICFFYVRMGTRD